MPRRAIVKGVSVRGDIDRPAFSVHKWESGLAAEHRRPEWKAADAALKLVDDLEAPTRIGLRDSEGLPSPPVVDKQLDGDPLDGNRPQHLSAERDGPFRAGPVRAHAELHACLDRLGDLRHGRIDRKSTR